MSLYPVNNQTYDFAEACKNIPNADVEYLKNVISVNNQTTQYDDIALKNMLASVRWNNPICDYCLDKSNLEKLFLCKKCKLTWYCSEYCQRSHSEKHSKRCCNLDGPLDDGPMQIAILKTK